MKILAVGDSLMSTRYYAEAFATLEEDHRIEYFHVDPARSFTPLTPSELRLREYQGSPGELAERMDGVGVLVVQGAPVSDEVLDASSALRLVCCARGGPVNVDVEAVAARGIPLVTTPGKNAEAVADLTLAFIVMVARRLPAAQAFLAEGNPLNDNWVGSSFMGDDLEGKTLGVLGFGQVGSRVAKRASGFGMDVLVYDPYVEPDGGHEWAPTAEVVLRRADFLSLHVRATPENVHMIDDRALALMKPGACLINTARESLVDENALDAALAAGRLGGAAVDVLEHSPLPGRHRLLRHDNVVLTPHIGGSTHGTLRRAARMIEAEIRRFTAGEPLVNVAAGTIPA
jgi:D-3-phosphoglycerate dehydrogenase